MQKKSDRDRELMVVWVGQAEMLMEILRLFLPLATI